MVGAPPQTDLNSLSNEELEAIIASQSRVSDDELRAMSDDELLKFAQGAAPMGAAAPPIPVETVDIPASEYAEPETTAGGVFGAIGRGLAPAALGAGLGFMTGAGPPGALAGAALTTLGPIVADPLVEGVNKLLGTDFATPTEALNNLLTAAGVRQMSWV
jgi:hypothetical protein